jgi:outer membrane protein assembly factor BamB
MSVLFRASRTVGIVLGVVILLFQPSVATGLVPSFSPVTAEDQSAFPRSDLAGVKAAPTVVLGSAATVPDAEDWPTYLHDGSRTGASLGPSPLNAKSAPTLALLWRFNTSGPVASSLTLANDTVYIGSWDGHEYALNATTGALLWKTYLGVTTTAQQPNCTALGVTSSATALGGFVYVGGGNGHWYALNASTGKVAWKVFVGSPYAGYYNWASPLIYDGSAYIGISSDCDHPLVRGGLLDVNLTSHAVVHAFYTVPKGSVGGSVWSSPAVDPARNTIYVTTGNPAFGVTTPPPYTDAIVALNATTLAVESHWQIPASQRIPDGDMSGTPTVFDNGTGASEVAASAKNGYTYIWSRTDLSKGPVWEYRASTGGMMPPCAWDGRYLFIPSGTTALDGVKVSGAIRAFDPTTLKFVWQRSAWGPVVAAPAVANGVVAVGNRGHALLILSAATGTLLKDFSYTAGIWGPPSMADGRLYTGVANDSVYAYHVPAATAAYAGAFSSAGASVLRPALDGVPLPGCPRRPWARLCTDFDPVGFLSAFGPPYALSIGAASCLGQRPSGSRRDPFGAIRAVGRMWRTR